MLPVPLLTAYGYISQYLGCGFPPPTPVITQDIFARDAVEHLEARALKFAKETICGTLLSGENWGFDKNACMNIL